MGKQPKKRGVFCNPYAEKVRRDFMHFVLWQLGYYRDPKPLPPVPENFFFPSLEEALDVEKPKVTWVNHSTFYIEVEDFCFLVDPIWNKRCSPIPFIGPKRQHAASPEIHTLKKVDYVIISHNHYDHLDAYTVRTLHTLFPQITWIVPLGVKKWFNKVVPQINHVVELKWWESINLKKNKVKCLAVPAQHFSGRGLLDQMRTLWMGCVVFVKTKQGEKSFYFAGDTGYNPCDFKKIGNRYGPIDLSLLPIGVYTPRRFMQPVHVNPQDAIRIHQDVASKLSIGAHWKTFRLSREALDRPPYDLLCELKNQNIPYTEFRVLDPGQTINW